MQKLTAFVARSFSERDEKKLLPISKRLESFQKVGFFCESGEPAEVESVSVKVRGLIDKCEVFVGVLTKRHPIYQLNGGVWERVKLAFGQTQPSAWTVPPWVLQELGYAIRAGKDVILFVEPDVEVPGLPGDLEHIRYSWEDPEDAFQKLSEMINGLIAKYSGITIERVIGEQAVAKSEEPKELTSPDKVKEQVEKKATLGECYTEIHSALASKDFQPARKAYEKGLPIARKSSPEMEILWTASYHRYRYRAGEIEGLEALKLLRENSKEYEGVISGFIGLCLFDYQEFEGACEEFKRAASQVKPGKETGWLTSAADCFLRVKKHREAEEILKGIVLSSSRRPEWTVWEKLYEALSKSGEHFYAFGIAEYALQQNPAYESFRFSLGLDYRKSKLVELFLYHYKNICEWNPEDLDAIHNLALAYDECDLPTSSVSSYRTALDGGVMLSMSNLGYKYLNAGFADDATSLIQKAVKKHGHAEEVAGCLAEVAKQRDKETENENKHLKLAAEQRQFFVKLGDGYLSPETPSIDSKWKFPFGLMPLKLTNSELRGHCELKIEERASLLAGLAGSVQPISRLKRYSLSGRVIGRACKFELKQETEGTSRAMFLGGSGESKKEGFIVFSEAGDSAQVCDLKDGKPEAYYQIKKIPLKELIPPIPEREGPPQV